jgi:adenine-specific DNA-methyltransferase
LIRNLLRQATKRDDLVLDFFAGSGTTAQAVLELNKEDEGARRFILVSSTEANNDEPGKNICRDVCAARVKGVINGYRNTPGTGGNFSYLRAKRLPTEQVFSDIQHEQVWLALQLVHFGQIAPYRVESSIQWVSRGGETLGYVTKLSTDAVAEIEKLAAGGGRMALYSWQLAQLRERIHAINVSFEKIPEFLVARFGGAK